MLRCFCPPKGLEVEQPTNQLGTTKTGMIYKETRLAGVKAGPGVTRVRELALPHTSCSTRESGPCTLPGQHTRADPAVWVRDDPALRA